MVKPGSRSNTMISVRCSPKKSKHATDTSSRCWKWTRKHHCHFKGLHIAIPSVLSCAWSRCARSIPGPYNVINPSLRLCSGAVVFAFHSLTKFSMFFFTSAAVDVVVVDEDDICFTGM